MESGSMHIAFISSVQRDYGGMRDAAARGAEAYGLRVLMAERTAAGGSARAALLDLVRQSDVFLLLVGGRYGDAAPGERSPTEEEFNEAVRAGLPIAAFVEECEGEPRQEEFLRRVRGTWGEESNLTASFRNADDLRAQVVAAWSN
jgi:hypothetical protein